MRVLCASSVRVGVCGVCVCSGDLEKKRKKTGSVLFVRVLCAGSVRKKKEKKRDCVGITVPGTLKKRGGRTSGLTLTWCFCVCVWHTHYIHHNKP